MAVIWKASALEQQGRIPLQTRVFSSELAAFASNCCCLSSWAIRMHIIWLPNAWISPDEDRISGHAATRILKSRHLIQVLQLTIFRDLLLVGSCTRSEVVPPISFCAPLFFCDVLQTYVPEILRSDTVKPLWIPDDSSSKCLMEGCDTVFSFLNRRHHCRDCGWVSEMCSSFSSFASMSRLLQLICSDCVGKAPLLKFHFKKEIVCPECYDKLEGLCKVSIGVSSIEEWIFWTTKFQIMRVRYFRLRFCFEVPTVLSGSEFRRERLCMRRYVSLANSWEVAVNGENLAIHTTSTFVPMGLLYVLLPFWEGDEEAPSHCYLCKIRNDFTEICGGWTADALHSSSEQRAQAHEYRGANDSGKWSRVREGDGEVGQPHFGSWMLRK